MTQAQEAAIKAVIDEMTVVATSDEDEDGPWAEWTSENRAKIDQWQVQLRDAIGT